MVSYFTIGFLWYFSLVRVQAGDALPAGHVMRVCHARYIRETGEPGKGARFEMVVPKGAYRFTDERKPCITPPLNIHFKDGIVQGIRPVQGKPTGYRWYFSFISVGFWEDAIL